MSSNTRWNIFLVLQQSPSRYTVQKPNTRAACAAGGDHKHGQSNMHQKSVIENTVAAGEESAHRMAAMVPGWAKRMRVCLRLSEVRKVFSTCAMAHGHRFSSK